MVSRNLKINDINKNKVSEGDELVIDVSSMDENDRFFCSNLGRRCLQDKTQRIEIKINKNYPVFKVSYTMLFLPENKIEKLNDYTFLTYVVGYATNVTQVDSVDCQESPIPTEFKLKGQTIHVGDTLIIPIKDSVLENGVIFNKKFYEENKAILDSLDYVRVSICEINDFLLKVRMTLVKDNVCLTNKTVYKVSDEDAKQDSFYEEVFESSTMPFQNQAEYLIQEIIKHFPDCDFEK